jgi:hypothetical protein
LSDENIISGLCLGKNLEKKLADDEPSARNIHTLSDSRESYSEERADDDMWIAEVVLDMYKTQ